MRPRNTLTRNGNFHSNSDADRLNLRRIEGNGGRGSVQRNIRCCMVYLKWHLLNDRRKNKYINVVLKSKFSNLVHACSEHLRKHSLPKDILYNIKSADFSPSEMPYRSNDCSWVHWPIAWQRL